MTSESGQSVFVDQMFQYEDKAAGQNAKTQEDEDAGHG